MSNNDTFSGDGKKGEEELLDFDFETSSGEDVGNEGSDFSLDEEILELVDIVEPGGDIEDSESDEIAKLLQEEPVEEPEEKVLDLELEELDKPREEDTSQILESDIGSVLDDLELSEDGVDEGEKLFEDSESDEIAKLLQEEPDEEDVGFEEETELDLEELEQIPEEDETQAFEADLDTTIARMEPAEEVDTELQLDEGDLESIYDDEALGVAKVEDEELAGLEESQEAPVGDGDTFDLGPETPPEIPYEDLSGVSEITEGALEDDMLSHLGQEITGISEERIESIIREVVEDVVERVARETMVTVAEKLIKSAIDALKESIESSRD
jgi:hypothetical protein